jgi:hypothetical protein
MYQLITSKGFFYVNEHPPSFCVFFFGMNRDFLGFQFLLFLEGKFSFLLLLLLLLLFLFLERKEIGHIAIKDRRDN